MDNYQRQQNQATRENARHSISSNLLMGTNTMKIQYLSTDFVGKTLESLEIDESELLENLMQYFNHDLVLMPFVQT